VTIPRGRDLSVSLLKLRASLLRACKGPPTECGAMTQPWPVVRVGRDQGVWSRAGRGEGWAARSSGFGGDHLPIVFPDQRKQTAGNAK